MAAGAAIRALHLDGPVDYGRAMGLRSAAFVMLRRRLLRRAAALVLALALIAHEIAITGMFAPAQARSAGPAMPCHTMAEPAPGSAADALPMDEGSTSGCPLMVGVMCLAGCAVLAQAGAELRMANSSAEHAAVPVRALSSLAVAPLQRPPDTL